MPGERLTGTLTIRLSAPLRRRLGRRALERAQTPSDVVRSLLERELNEPSQEEQPTLLQLARDFVGSVASTAIPAGRDAKKALARWRPGRRA